MTHSKADIILFNGQIRTQDDRNPFVNALAISGTRIRHLGSDKEILKFESEMTRTINLNNRLVLPGFTDTHFHFYEWTLNYDSIDLAKATSFKEMQAKIKQKAAAVGKGNWVMGQGFNESDWPENQMPNRHDLDDCAPDNPVCIWRCDLHLAVANTFALTLAGIDKNCPDPKDGVIVKDAANYPTGVLKELAPNLIRSVLPEMSEPVLLDNMKKAIKEAHQLGLTSIHDIRLMGGMEGADAFRNWQRLNKEDNLHIRCHVGITGEMTDQAIQLGLMTGFGDDLLKTGHLKFFSDGGMGARTAWMTEKYLDAEYGMPLTPVTEIERAVQNASQAGLSVMVHAVGDRANREMIELFTRIEQQGINQCRIPHRIEHVQMILPKDLQKLGRLKNIAVSCQPNNMSLDISMIDQCAGERAKYAYCLKDIMETGVPLMLSSDAPVSDPRPLAGIYSAVNRKRMDDTPEQGWYPDQRLNVEQAVKAYTLTPALASGTGSKLGSITPGKFADIIVLDQDIYHIEPRKIAETNIDVTIFNGQIVHER